MRLWLKKEPVLFLIALRHCSPNSMTKRHYNIASSAVQSNSVYVSVLKIPIVHADSVCKSLRQKFFFSRERPLLARGKIIYFATIMDTNRDSAHQSQNEDNFPTFSLGLEFLNEAKKRKTTEEETRHQRRHDSLLCHFWYCCPFLTSDLMHNSTGYVMKQ